MAITSENELFDPAFLGRLRALFFKLRKRRQLQKKGAQASNASGFTREFKDHRQYVSGDDYRAVDWRLFARLEKLFIRIYEEVQEFHVHILVDRSLSMAEPHGAKRLSALRLAVALAYLALVSQHRVSILSFTDSLRRETQPLKGQGSIHEVLRAMAGLRFDSETNLKAALQNFRPGKDRRGIVFVISDLFGTSPGESEEALLAARSWPAETHVVHILHPEEMKPSMEGEIQLVDTETGETRRIWMTQREIDLYEKQFRDYLDQLQTSCLRRQMDYLTWSTAFSFEDLFLQLLSRGTALARG